MRRGELERGIGKDIIVMYRYMEARFAMTMRGVHEFFIVW